jgi:alkanesulfonate monooxygenase SsuD/methylene tetrahydromethanopterin reductase-like flavin-dependent oxidoreductase (luciferase family)
MRFGTCLPYMGPDYSRRTTLEWCRRIDASPFATLSCGERITSGSQEMRVLLAAAAALTERVTIMPSLYVLPMHDPVWAAKEVATLDVLSAGRVTLVVGIGGREDDYRAVGASFGRRHERLDAQVERMRRIWRGEPPFEGAEPVGPPPVQAGGPPILAGAMGPRAIARAARWADGVYGFSVNAALEPVRTGFALAERAWQEAGRRERPRQLTGFWYSLADDADARLKQYAYDYLKIGGEAQARAVAQSMTTHHPDAILRAIDAIEALGCDELFLVPATAEVSELERASELLLKRG